MRLLVDADDVLASWGVSYDEDLDTHGESAALIPRRHARSTWDLRAGRTPEEKGIIESIMVAPGFYARLEPIPGARTALREMVRKGHDVRIVTAPYISNPTCASDKIAWFAKHYGTHWAQRVVITTDKTLVRGDVLIDDRPEVTGSMTPEWKHIVFGDYPYNAHITDRVRLTDWSQWESAARYALEGALA